MYTYNELQQDEDLCHMMALEIMENLMKKNTKNEPKDDQKKFACVFGRDPRIVGKVYDLAADALKAEQEASLSSEKNSQDINKISDTSKEKLGIFYN